MRGPRIRRTVDVPATERDGYRPTFQHQQNLKSRRRLRSTRIRGGSLEAPELSLGFAISDPVPLTPTRSDCRVGCLGSDLNIIEPDAVATGSEVAIVGSGQCFDHRLPRQDLATDEKPWILDAGCLNRIAEGVPSQCELSRDVSPLSVLLVGRVPEGRHTAKDLQAVSVSQESR